jgi:O-antigen ligase
MTVPAAARPLSQVAKSRSRFDLLQGIIAMVLLCYVWRIQDLVPGLGALKLPSLATVAAIAVVALDPRVALRFQVAKAHLVARTVPWFALFALISVVFSIAPRWSLSFFAMSFMPAVALAVVIPSCIFAAKDGVRFAAIQVFGATLYCIAVFLRFEVDATGRLTSLVYYDSNDIGMLLVCTLPLCAYFVRHGPTWFTRALALGITLLFLTTIARTGSRGAFLGLVVVGAYLLVYFRSARLLTRALLVAGTTAVLLLGAGERYRELMSTILHPTRDYNWVDGGDSGRMNIWRRGLQYAADAPLTGVGIWAFPIAEGTISELAERQEYSRGVKWSAAHNSFVQVLAELGVAGFVAFLTIVFASWRTAKRLARDTRRLEPTNGSLGELANAHAASIVGYVVSGFFLSQAYAPYLYFVVGMIIGLDITIRGGSRLAALQHAGRFVVRSEWRSRRERPASRLAAEPAAHP